MDMDKEDMDITENAGQEAIENTEDSENTENPEIAENTGAPARNLRKERTGIVVSNKMKKTIVVKIEERVTHEKYGKIMRNSIKFKAHDENNECDIGDKVLIMETRPLSKDKHFRLVKILEKVK